MYRLSKRNEGRGKYNLFSGYLQHFNALDSEVLSESLHGVSEDVGRECVENIFMTMSKGTETLKASEDVEDFEKNYSKMKQMLEDLKKTCTELRKMEEDKLRLLKGQLAFETRNGIVELVLDGLVSPDEYIVDITDMEMAIEGKPGYDDVFKTEKDRALAESKWKQLQSELGWTGKHSRYIQNLIEEYYVPLTDDFKLDTKVFEDALDCGILKVEDGDPFLELLELSKKIVTV